MKSKSIKDSCKIEMFIYLIYTVKTAIILTVIIALFVWFLDEIAHVIIIIEKITNWLIVRKVTMFDEVWGIFDGSVPKLKELILNRNE